MEFIKYDVLISEGEISSYMDFSLTNDLVTIFISKEKSLESQLKNKEAFNETLSMDREVIEFDDSLSVMDSEYEKLMLDYYENFFNNNSIIEKAEHIKLDIESMDVKKFINDNPILKTKKLVINEQLQITETEKIEKYLEQYSGMTDKIHIMLKGNISCITLDECKAIMDMIKTVADKIKSLGLSPLENIMYIYDFVRNRVYVKESEEEEYTKSRDLSEVLTGNKIVCLGYANIFQAILNHLQYLN